MKIVLEHLTKQFPPRGRKAQEPVTAVSDFNFEVPDGQLIGLLGPSGCGKSTTLNMICGLEKPTSGRILFGDDDVTSFPPEHRGVGMVFQNYALYPHLTVKQNILFPLQNLKGKDKLSRSQMDERAQNAARLVQITELMDRRSHCPCTCKNAPRTASRRTALQPGCQTPPPDPGRDPQDPAGYKDHNCLCHP